MTNANMMNMEKQAKLFCFNDLLISENEVAMTFVILCTTGNTWDLLGHEKRQ